MANKQKAKERMNKLKNIGFVKMQALLSIDEDGDYYLKSEDLLEIDVLEMNSCGCMPTVGLYLSVG